MNPPRLELISTSAATDGGYTAIHDVGAFLDPDNHRLIGGIAVMLHQYRLGLDHPIRATSDADFGIPPYLLKDDSLIDRIASLGYEKIAGNRWQRKIDDTRTATVDLLVPSYVTRQKSNVKHGSTRTTEVGGLAVALKRPPVRVTAEVRRPDDTTLALNVLIPDAASMLSLKLHARTRRDEPRDAIDVWTCMEVLFAADQIGHFADADFDDIRPTLATEFADDGPSMHAVTHGYADEEVERRRTRIRALVKVLSSR